MNKLQDKNFIADVQQALKDKPIIVEFLELYCGFWDSVNSSNPYDISYSGGKRDVVLTVKTIMRDDLLPEQIAKTFEEK